MSPPAAPPPDTVPLWQVDAFTDHPFAGNPAAVCLLQEARGADWMQAVAREMNLSETAFPVPRSGGGGFDLRWFTPTAEVDLCGHATLASAHVLWESGVLPASEPARFHTRSGLLTAEPAGGGWIEMDFPAEPPDPGYGGEAPGEVAAALGVAEEDLLRVAANRFDLLVELGGEERVRALAPDLGRLERSLPVRGVIVTALSSSAEHDFVSRFFAPGFGVPEDPVTGSAHCCLGPYWGQRLGKEELVGYQASRRGGVVRVRLAGERVKLGGQAVTVMVGELRAG